MPFSRKELSDSLRDAMHEVCDSFSVDRVVADPQMNAEFVAACRRLGLEQSVAELNWLLFNERKKGNLASSSRARSTTFPDLEDFRFASEIAARVLQQKHGTTLDRIICDPALATELDALAASMAPGFDSLRYRWAALSLRKNSRLKPELLARMLPPTSTQFGAVPSLSISDLPTSQGLYLFYCPTETLYVGEAENLRKRVGKHLDHSDNKSLARWFWESGFQDVKLELWLLPNDTPTPKRRAIESDLIRSRHPAFNVQRP